MTPEHGGLGGNTHSRADVWDAEHLVAGERLDEVHPENLFVGRLCNVRDHIGVASVVRVSALA